MDSRVSQGGASGGRSARHRSSLRPFCRPTPRRGPKGGLFCRPTPCRGQKGGLFCTVPGCAAKKAVCFVGQHPVGVKKAVCFAGQHPVGVKNTVCFVGQHPVGVKKAACFAGQHPVGHQKAVCFAPFRAARSKRRPVLHRSGLRGQKGGLFCTPPPRGAAVLALHSGLTIKRSRVHNGNPIMYPAYFAVVAADVLSRALGVRSGLREQVVLERLEGARHRHTAFLALHKGSEPLGDLDRATCGRLHRVEELGRVSRLEENARLARL